MQDNADRSSAAASDSDALRVAAEPCDVALYPLESRHLFIATRSQRCSFNQATLLYV